MSIKKNKSLISLIILFFLILLFHPKRVESFQLYPDCYSAGNCTLCDLINTFINIGVLILGFIGALALLFFILGGFLMLVSAGDTGKIDKAKKIMTNSVIGFLIVIFAYSMVAIIIFIFTKESNGLLPPNLKCGSITDTNKDANKCEENHPGWSCIDLGINLYNKCKGKTPSFCEVGLCPGDADMCCEKKPTTECD